MPKSDLATPLRSLRLEYAWLYAEFSKSATSQIAHQSELTCEMVVIRAYDAWARFCRELIITSAYGNTVTLGGATLAKSLPAISNRASVVPVLLSTYKRNRYEPDWDRANDCVDAGTRLAISNLSTVAGALGATNSPADQVRHVRNYYAHRRQGTCDRALATGYFPNLNRPIVYQLNAYTTGGITVMQSWIDGLLTIATAAVQ
jgi:hypothetical protein